MTNSDQKANFGHRRTKILLIKNQILAKIDLKKQKFDKIKL